MTTRVARGVLATLTLAAAATTLSGCSLLSSLTGSDANPTPTAISTDGADTDVFTIKVGDCLNDGSVEGEVSSVKVIDCAKPHDSEAFASIQMDDGDFPGQDAIDEKAIPECTAAFAQYVGIEYDASTLSFSYYYPTEASWGQGDREILCLVVDPNTKTTGTLKGAAR